MNNAPLEDRVTTLEKQVAELTGLLHGVHSDKTPKAMEWPESKSDWIAKVSGKITDVEGFEEVLRLGREWRASQPAAEDEDF